MNQRGPIAGKRVLGLALLALLSGCAGLQAALLEADCNPDAAYAAGMNDGKNGEDMVPDYASSCPSDDGINAAYRKGFQFGLARGAAATSVPATARPHCISSFGNKICGFDCKKSGTQAKCASTSDQKCVVGPFQEIECGYNCVKTAFAARCAKRMRHNCVSDGAGDVKCGLNCRVDYGNLTCDSEES